MVFKTLFIAFTCLSGVNAQSSCAESPGSCILAHDSNTLLQKKVQVSLEQVDDLKSEAQKYAFAGCYGFRIPGFAGGDMVRQPHRVPATIAGVQQCRDACAGGGYKYFGFLCPHFCKRFGKNVQCECGHADALSGTSLSNDSVGCQSLDSRVGPCDPLIVSGSIGTYAMGVRYDPVYAVEEAHIHR